MIIDHSTLVFFDASCLIAAAGSKSGGSAFLLSLCARRLLRGAVSQLVLLEAERNIQSKLGGKALSTYHHLLLLAPLMVAPVPQTSHRQRWHQFVNEKDVHVVTAVLASKAPYLLTLDRQLKAEINQAGFSFQTLDPCEFIKTVLPHHTNYPSLRT